MELPWSSIVIGERARKEMGDLAALADSIRETGGPLHPPVVRLDGKQYLLVCGARRLAAMRKLGYDRVEVRVAVSLTDEIAALDAERDENTCRKDFTPSEAVAIAARRDAVESAAAKERQGTRTDLQPCAESAQGSDDGKTRSRVAKAVGMSHPKLAEARAVVDAAADESLPEPVREVAKEAVADMDRTGNVHGAHRKVEQAKLVNRPDVKALADLINGDADVQAAKWRAAFAKSIVRLTEVMQYPTEDVVATADDDQLEMVERAAIRLDEWIKQVQAARPKGLRLVNGGRS